MSMCKRTTRCLWLIVLFASAFHADVSSEEDFSPVSLSYATGFTLEYHDTYKVLTVLTPWMGADVTFQYVLVQRGTVHPEGYEAAQYIEIPVRTLVTMSTTYLGPLAQLDLLDRIVGHDNVQFVSHPHVRKRIQQGTIREIGEGPAANVELLLELNPDLIMTHGDRSMYDTHPRLFEAGLPVAINGAYMEPTPLARAEWIKYIAAFFNAERKAERVFQRIAAHYERLAEKAGNVATGPTVLVNAPYNDTWWIPGGRSSVAKMLQDAGARYIWADDPAKGAQPLDVEAVYERAYDADYWLNPGRWSSLQDALQEDERFALFQAFQKRNVYNRNARTNEYGWNEYWETGLSRPDIVLKDVIKIFHPELVPDHEWVYYQQLQ